MKKMNENLFYIIIGHIGTYICFNHFLLYLFTGLCKILQVWISIFTELSYREKIRHHQPDLMPQEYHIEHACQFQVPLQQSGHEDQADKQQQPDQLGGAAEHHQPVSKQMNSNLNRFTL